MPSVASRFPFLPVRALFAGHALPWSILCLSPALAAQSMAHFRKMYTKVFTSWDLQFWLPACRVCSLMDRLVDMTAGRPLFRFHNQLHKCISGSGCSPGHCKALAFELVFFRPVMASLPDCRRKRLARSTTWICLEDFPATFSLPLLAYCSGITK